MQSAFRLISRVSRYLILSPPLQPGLQVVLSSMDQSHFSCELWMVLRLGIINSTPSQPWSWQRVSLLFRRKPGGWYRLRLAELFYL